MKRATTIRLSAWCCCFHLLPHNGGAPSFLHSTKGSSFPGRSYDPLSQQRVWWILHFWHLSSPLLLLVSSSSPPSVSHPFYSYPSHLISSVHQCWPLKVWYFDPLHDLPVQRLTRHSRNFHHILDVLPALVVVYRVGPQDWLVFVLQSKVVQVLSTKCFTWVKFPICLNLPQKTRNFSAKLKIYFEQLSVFFTQIHFNSSL